MNPLQEKNNEAKLLSTKDASKMSGYNSDYLARLCKSGKITGTQIGRTWLVSQESLEAFVKEQSERKQELREQLSETREKEYKTAQLSTPASKLSPLQPSVHLSEENFTKKIQKHNDFQKHGVAVLAAVVVMLFGVCVAQAAPLSTFGEEALATSLAVSDGFRTIAYDALTTATTHADREVASVSSASRAKFVFVSAPLAPATTNSKILPHAALSTSKVYASTASTSSEVATSSLVAETNAGPFADAIVLASTTRIISHTVRSTRAPRISYVQVHPTQPNLQYAVAETAMPQLADFATTLGNYELGAVLHSRAFATALAYAEMQSYLDTGSGIYTAITNGMSAYANGIQASGNDALALGAFVRDTSIQTPITVASTLAHTEIHLAIGWSELSQNILRSYSNGVYAYVNKAPIVPAEMTRFALNTGAVLGGSASQAPAAVVQGYNVAMNDWVTGTPVLATSIVKGEIGLGIGTYSAASLALNTEKDAVDTGANIAYTAVTGGQNLISVLPVSTQKTATTLRASADDAALGALGNSALGLSLFTQSTVPSAPKQMLAAAETVLTPAFSEGLIDTQNLAAAIIPTQSLSSAEQAALITYETIHGFFTGTSTALAYLFGITPDIAHAPATSPTKIATKAGSSNSTAGATGARGASGNSVVINRTVYVSGNSPVTPVPSGVSQTYVDDAINALRNSIQNTILGQSDAIINPVSQSLSSIQSEIAVIQQYTGITIEKSIFDSGTITNSNFLAGNIATSTFTGGAISNSTIASSTFANGSIASSTFTGGSINTNAITTGTLTITGTTTLSGNFAAATSTITGGLLVTGDSVVTGTSTTQNLISTNATTTNSVTTNAVTTNATTTNENVTNLTATNATSTNAFIASLNAGNSSTTNAFAANFIASNASTTNFFGSNGIFTNLFATNATTTNSVMTNATSTNFFATLAQATTGIFANLQATVANLTSATIATLTGTNSTFINATTTNATSTNFFATNLTGTNGVFGNLLATIANLTSAVITNLTATNATLTNFASTNATTTNATTTNEFATNAVNTNATSTNEYAISLNSVNASSTNAFATNSVTQNATSTNFAAASGTITNLSGTNAVIAQATTTSFYASLAHIASGVFDNFTSTLATITGLNVTNSTTTNATTTNFYATNGTINTLVSTLANIASIASTNIFTVNFGATNATTTNATSTNQFATNAVTTNATSTNQFAANSVTTNATSTNQFATNLTATNATLTNGTITNLTTGTVTANNSSTTNSTSTNATSTNLYALNGNFGNATSTNFFATLAQATTGIFASLQATVANIANLASTNIITTNLATTNATTTNATSTNQFATNLNTTNAIIGNSTTTNAFATNSVATNLTATSGIITNATTTNLATTNFTGVAANITNLTSGSAVLTNATSTNFNTTNFTGTNATIASATLSTLNTSTLNGTSANLASLNVTGTTTTGGLSLGSLNGFLKATAGAIGTSLINLTTDVTGILPVPNGGTGTSSFSTNGVVYGNGTSNLLTTGQGGANTILTANNGAPAFSSAVTIGTSVTSPILNSTSQIQLNGANINTAGTLSNVGYLNQAETFVGNNIYSGTSNFTGNTTLANATSTSEYTSTFGLGANYFTSLLGTGLSDAGGVLTVSLTPFTTTNLAEGSNLYFTNARAIASTLTGFTSGAGTVTASDSILSAIQKINGNIGALVTGVSSVANSDGSLTITPTTGAVVASLNPAHANTFSALQTFGNTVATNATSTSEYTSTFGLSGNYFTSLTGSGLSDVNGVLTNTAAVSTSSLATKFYQQGGNAFGAAATLGTTDNNSLTFLTNNTARETILANGNVGIGTSTPGSALAVSGSGYFNGNLTAASLIATSSVTTPSLTVSGLTSGSVPFIGTGGAFTQDNSNFAYNTTNHTLTINSAGGQPTIQNTVTGNGLILSGSNGSVSGQLRIVANGGGWADSQATTYFQASNTTNNNLTFQGGSYGTDAILSRLQFDASSTQFTDGAYGSTAVPGSLFAVIDQSAAKKAFIIQGASGQIADLFEAQSSGGTVLDSINSSGLLTTPNSIDTGLTTNTLTYANGSQQLSSVTLGTGLTFSGGTLAATASGTVGTGTTGQFPYYAANGTTLTATSSLFLATNGDIGVGTTNPLGLIHVSAPSGTNALLGVQSGGNSYFAMQANSAANSVSFGPFTGTNNINQALTITGGGNIGIGTTTPNVSLSVNGQIAIPYGGTGALMEPYFTRTNIVSSSFINGHDVLSIGSPGNTPTPYYDFTDGNVGIATTTPVSTLSVAGTGYFSGALSANGLTLNNLTGTQCLQEINGAISGTGTTCGSGGGGSGTVSAGTTGQFPYYAANGNVLTATSSLFLATSGNIGIGTTAPTDLLTINALLNDNGITLQGATTTGISPTLKFLNSLGTIYARIGIAGKASNLSVGSAANDLVFRTEVTSIGFTINGGASEALTIASSTGNVGIGTTVPVAKLDVNGPSGVTSFTGLTDLGLMVQGSASTNDYSGIDFGGDSASTVNNRIASIGVLSTVSGSTLEFGTSNLYSSGVTNTAMVINPNGNVGIGQASPGYVLDVGNVGVSGIVARFTNSTGNCTINPTTTSLSCSSDERLKDNIAPIAASQDSLAKLDALSPVFYNWNAEVAGTPQHAGFIAQAMQQVYPDLVSTDPTTGYLTLNYGGLTPYIVAGLQELDSKFTSFASSTVALETADGLTTGTTGTNNGASGTSAASPTFANLSVNGSINSTGALSAATVTTTGAVTVGGTASASDYDLPLSALTISTGSGSGSASSTQSMPAAALNAAGNMLSVANFASYTFSSLNALTAQTSAVATQTNSLSTALQSLTTRVANLENMVATTGMSTSSLEAAVDGATASSTPADLATTIIMNALNGMGVLVEQGIAQFNTLVVRDLVFSKDSDGTSAAGSGTILAGNTTVQIQNSHMLASSQVSVTLTSPMTGNWYVTNKADGSFQVTMSAAQQANVTFDYLIIQTQGQIATSTPVGATNAGQFSISSWLASLFGGSSTSQSGTSGASGTNGSDSTGTSSAGSGSESGTGSGSTLIPVPTGPAVPNAPTITLLGSPAISLNQGDDFIDPGATAVDASSTDITSSIVEQGSVNTAVGGLYTLTYSVTDSQGRSAQVSRIVTVTANPGAAGANGDTGNGTGLTSVSTTNSTGSSTSAPGGSGSSTSGSSSGSGSASGSGSGASSSGTSSGATSGSAGTSSSGSTSSSSSGTGSTTGSSTPAPASTAGTASSASTPVAPAPAPASAPSSAPTDSGSGSASSGS